ncbi:hypothetical protein JCM5350_004238 [Sporobolomyces pararoseus]
MVAWLLKLLIVSLNIRSTSKSLSRKSRSGDGGNSVVRSTPRKKRLKGELTNWIVWVCFLMVEQLCDRLISWIPFYGTFKTLLLLMLLVSRGAGSQILFNKLIKPSVKPWEGTLDFIGFVLGEFLEITVYCLLIAPRWAVKQWRSRNAEPDVPSILRGLRTQNPVPPMAETLAQSIERQQGHSDKINERFSQPVTIRLNPLQSSQQPRRKPTTSSVLPQTVPKPLLPHPGRPPSLPPPSFSTAPFRPIKPAASTARAPTQTSSSSRTFQPVASTSRLPISSSCSSAPSTSSIYPSLQSLPPAPTTSFTPLPAQVQSPVVSPPAPPKPAPSAPSLQTDSTPPTRRSVRKSRTSTSDPTPANLSSPNRSPRSSTSAPIVPPTPAPPGAFTFSSSASLPSPHSRPEAIETDLMQIDVDEQSLSKSEESTPKKRRRSSRTTERGEDEQQQITKNAKRSIGKVDEPENSEVETPKKKKLKSSPIVERRSAASKEKGKGKATTDGEHEEREVDSSATKVSATPRQRALGAISKLATDLLDAGEDGDGLVGLSSAKKGKGKLGSVLARSSSTAGGISRKGPAPAVATRSRRGPAKETEEDKEEEVVLPRKRRAGRVATKQTEQTDEGLQKKPVRKTTTARHQVENSKIAPRGKTSRLNSTVPSTTSTSRRSTTVLASRTSSRAASPANNETALKNPEPQQGPKRKARRVLRRTDGVADIEDEVEVEGVAVVAGRRRR